MFTLALDQGTTSSRAILFNGDFRIAASAQRDVTQIYPKPGWVEHDPEDLWKTQIESARAAIFEAGIHARDITAIGIANQRETTLLWDRTTGIPLANAIVWQDRRTADMCARLRTEGAEPLVRKKTGLLLDPYFSATKIAWLLDHNPDSRERAFRGDLAFGTVDSFLLWRLTGGRVHATDVTNASRTLLFNIHSLDWDDELLSLFGIPRAVLPAVMPSGCRYGESDPAHFGSPIPICGMAGDQQAAAFGQACVRPGMVKNTYGTGSFLLMNTGREPRPSAHRLLTTVALQIPDSESRMRTDYALEGSIFVSGAAVQWLRDELGIIESAAETEAIARSVEDSQGVYMVPAFAGLGAPYWDSSARGAIVGLTRGAGRPHIVRAALEAAAYQTRDVVEAMAADAASPIPDMRADGGMASNDFLLQFQADILGIPVHRPAVTETTALGAATLATLTSGMIRGIDAVESGWRACRTFEPTMSRDQSDHLYRGWKRAVTRVLGGSDDPA